MPHREFLIEMETILDMPSDSLTGTELLAGCEAWDSLAMLAFNIFASEKFKVEIPGTMIRGARTVDDLYALGVNGNAVS